MIETANPIQARAVGRALAWLPVCRLHHELAVLGQQRQSFPVMYNTITDEYRAVVSYMVLAFRDTKYLVDQGNQTAMAWTTDLLTPEMADGQMHMLHISYLLDHQLQPQRLSRSHHARQYHYFLKEQAEVGIVPGHPLYIHPLDRLSKDVVLMRLLQGEPIDNPQDAVVQEFRNIEEMGADYRGQPLYNKVS